MDITKLYKPSLSSSSGQKVPIPLSDVLMQFVHWLINESQNPPFNIN